MTAVETPPGGLRRRRPLSRRTALLGLLAGAAAVTASAAAHAAEAARRRARRNEAATNGAAAARRSRRPAEAAGATGRRGVAPALDPPPAHPAQPGRTAAPVPSTNLQPPPGDLVPQPDLAFGVPGPREFGAGASARGSDPSPDAREAADRASALPTPGFMLRLPF
jgi:hypothetical protein